MTDNRPKDIPPELEIDPIDEFEFVEDDFIDLDIFTESEYGND
jgi:hypothetical protein